MDAVPRGHRRHRTGSPRLRPLGQARIAAVHDRRVRRLHRALPRHGRRRAGAAGRPRLGCRRPRLRPTAPRAGAATRDRQRGAAAPRLPLAPHGAHLANPDARRAGDGRHLPPDPEAGLPRGQRQARPDAGVLARQRDRPLRPGHPEGDPQAVPQLPTRGAGAGWRTTRGARDAGPRRLGHAGPLHPGPLRRRVRGRAAPLRAGGARRRRPLAVARPPGSAAADRGLPEPPVIASAEPPVIASARRAPAWTITALMGLVYVFISPPSSDLAAASYRSALFPGEGFTLWDNSWSG